MRRNAPLPAAGLRIDSILSDTVLLPELARLEYITIPVSVLVPPATLGCLLLDM